MQGKRNISIVASLLIVCVALSGCTVFKTPNSTSPEPGSVFQPDSGEEEEIEPAPVYRILNVGDEAPDFSVSIINGKNFVLSEAREKVVLIYFWTTWCAPCLNEMSGIQEIYDNSSRDELEIVAVNSGEKLSRVKKFLEQNSYSFPLAADEEFEIGDKYPNSGVPYVVIVGRDGVIAEIFAGSKDGGVENFQTAIYALLGK